MAAGTPPGQPIWRSALLVHLESSLRPGDRWYGLDYGFGDGECVLGKDAEIGGGAEENAHAFETFFVEDVVDVGGEIGADGLFLNGEFGGPFGYEGIDVRQAVVAGLD